MKWWILSLRIFQKILMKIKKNDKIFVAGHLGLVGSAIVRNLKAKGYKKIITATRKKIDLMNQKKHLIF